MKTFNHKTCDMLEVGWKYKYKSADIWLTVIAVDECIEQGCTEFHKEEARCSCFKADFNSSDGRLISKICVNDHLKRDLRQCYYGPLKGPEDIIIEAI